MGTSSDKAALLALLKKYRAGRCTPEETDRIQKWFDSFEELPENEEMKAAADQVVVNTMHRLFQGERSVRFILLSAAAVLLVAVTGLMFVYRFFIKAPAPVTYSSVTTGQGERKKLTLPDGTTLTMNAGTTISIPSNFGDTTRELVLEGQGTFDIRQNIEKPFVIRTGNVRTVVLGTSFDIKAYPGERSMQVAVLNGKVRIEKQESGHTEVLAPGVTRDQLLTYDEGSGKHELKRCNAENIAGWQQNRLFFEQATLKEIAQVLERQYNTHITLIGTAKHTCRYTLLLKNEKLDNALQLIEQLSGISYQVNNNEIKINIASCE
jgi:ferric-dicitrate binding protein FerR (iron transport regulator)